MKFGVLGDIHGNLSALKAALEGLERHGVDTVLSVGDVVGYGAAPGECIELLRAVGARVVQGNHDAAVVGQVELLYFNNYAREAVLWTRSVLSKQDHAWLEALPLVIDEEQCSVAHGTYAKPELFNYIQSTTDADPSLDLLETPICFVGHTHVPVTLLRLLEDPHRTAYTVEDEVDLSESRRALANVGSVGQPRDEDSRAAYAVYDSEADRLNLYRVEYDIEREAARIRTAGLPGVLADRLYMGV